MRDPLRGHRAGVVTALVDLRDGDGPDDGLVVRRHGDLGVGEDVDPLDVVLEIGSVTKVFTATLLAVLVHRGTVRLDTPVQDLLPDGVVVPVVGRPLTLLDLTTHTSGLPRLPPGWLRRAWRHADDPYSCFTEDDLWTAVASSRRRRRPGRVRYSNYGVGLLGSLLGRAAGRPWQDLVRTEVLDPLGLVDTGVEVPAGAAHRLAPGHDPRGRPVPAWHFPVLAGAGALHSTARDLVRFLRAHGDADSPLADALAQTRTRRAGHPASGVALGWMTAPGALWHNGGTGGYRSFVALRPGAGRGVVVLASSARSVDAAGMQLLGPEPPRGSDPSTGEQPGGGVRRQGTG